MAGGIVRQAAAEAVGKPAEIDWEHYREKLPSIDIDAFKENYENYVSKIPAQTYDEAADLADHAKQVRSAVTLSSCYCRGVGICEAAGSSCTAHRGHAAHCRWVDSGTALPSACCGWCCNNPLAAHCTAVSGCNCVHPMLVGCVATDGAGSNSLSGGQVDGVHQVLRRPRR